MNTKTKKILALSVSLILSLAILISCGPNTEAQSKVAGAVLLSVNPEIEIDYEQNGNVVEVIGLNSDGHKIVENQKNKFKDENIKSVLGELIEEIYEAGYFEETIEDKDKNVIIKLAAGSHKPSEHFLQDLEEIVVLSLEKVNVKSETISVAEDQLDEHGRISRERAKEIVLAQFNLEAAEFEDIALDDDEEVYELEFYANTYEYDVDMHAVSGKILDYEIDKINNEGDSQRDKSKNISLEQAKEIALDYAGLNSADFTESKYDKDDNKYELEFQANKNAYEIEIDAANGKILEIELEKIPEKNSSTEPGSQISLAQAKEIALAKAGLKSANFTKAEYDEEDDSYELEFHSNGKYYEVEVAARSGDILDFEVDNVEDGRDDTDDEDGIRDGEDDNDKDDDRDEENDYDEDDERGDGHDYDVENKDESDNDDHNKEKDDGDDLEEEDEDDEDDED